MTLADVFVLLSGLAVGGTVICMVLRMYGRDPTRRTMPAAPHAGDGGMDPGQSPGAPSESVTTVVVSETTEPIGSGLAAPPGASTRISIPIWHEWEVVESGPERIPERVREECRAVWARWVAEFMERAPFINWTYGGFGPSDVTCREGKKASGERFCRCVVHLRCWAEYQGRLDSLDGEGGTREVGPALTPEAWLEYAPLDRTLAQYAPAVAQENAHAAAALALHGQPHGFTWDDYYELLDTAHDIVRDNDGDFMAPEVKRQVDALRSMAARIAALLPPKEGQDQEARCPSP